MTGSAFLAILGVALGFSAGFAAGSIWTAMANQRRAAKRRHIMWVGLDHGAIIGDPDEINRQLRAVLEKLDDTTPTQSETDNDHRPR